MNKSIQSSLYVDTVPQTPLRSKKSGRHRQAWLMHWALGSRHWSSASQATFNGTFDTVYTHNTRQYRQYFAPATYTVGTHPIPADYSFIDPERMRG